MSKLALYFGYGDGGHFLRGLGLKQRTRTLDPQRDCPGFPWTISHLDTGLLKNGKVPDAPDGRVYWTCGGRPDLWFAFFWWDRSGDKRGNSNSGFYVRGFEIGQEREAFEYACACWPDAVSRQQYKLVLQERYCDKCVICGARRDPQKRGVTCGKKVCVEEEYGS